MQCFSKEEQEVFIQQSLELARKAESNGNHPFGALLVDKTTKEIICRAENTVNTSQCPTRHAEFNLVEEAYRTLKKEQIHNSVLFTSTEPCPMCCGAIYWGGIRTVIYSCPAIRLGEIAKDSFCGPCDALFNQALNRDSNNHDVYTEVIGPILIEQGVDIHAHYWTDML